MKDIIQFFRTELKSQEIKKNLFFIFLVSTFFVLPFLFYGNLYRDDADRAINGTAWNHDARYLNTFLMRFLSLDHFVMNFYPYAQWLASFFFALSGYLVFCSLGLGKKNLSLLALIPLFWPFTLENLSFQYDSHLMGFSLVLAAFPFLLKDRIKIFFPSSILALFLVLLNYQPSFSVYAVIVMIHVLSYALQDKEKEALKLFALSALASLVGLLFYKLFLSLPVFRAFPAGYLEYKSATFLDTEYPFQTLMGNIRNVSYKIWDLLGDLANKGHFRHLVLVIVLLALVRYVYVWLSPLKTINKILIGLSLLSFPVLILALPVTILFPVIAGGRVFSSFSFSLVALLFFISSKWEKLANALALLIMVLSIPLATSLTFAQNSQIEFDKSLMAMIFADLDTTGKQIIVQGKPPRSPIAERVRVNFPFACQEREMVPSLFTLFYHSAFMAYGVADPALENVSEKLPLPSVPPIVKRSLYYYVRMNEETLIIDFDKREELSL